MKQNHTEKIRALLISSMRKNPAEGILLSGGLDTSILAYLSTLVNHSLKSITICIRETPGPDEAFAQLVARRLQLEHHLYYVSLKFMLEQMKNHIAILQTFDPMELRNSIVIYCGLQRAQTLGLKSVYAGDAADELFAGYSYMFRMEPNALHKYVRYLAKNMHFTAPQIGRYFGIVVRSPYNTSGMRRLATSLSFSEHVGKKGKTTMGKWILRRTFEQDLPVEIIWRKKTPIEYGSGSTHLTQFCEKKISTQEFQREQRKLLAEDHVQIRDKEHLEYYRIYRKLFGAPKSEKGSGKRCPQCHGLLQRLNVKYCFRCGAYPIG